MLILASNTGWVVGYTIGIVVVVVVVALVVPILLLARRIGEQAAAVNSGLQKAVVNTAALAELSTTIESAEAIVAGLERGRQRLGG
jgi:cell division protein FtsB